MTIHSVSILFYVKDYGFLICNEMRKKFRSNEREFKSHLIGGKVEEFETPLKAACREFMEEYGKTEDHFALYNAVCNAKYGYFDVLVSLSKCLEHRFYVVNTSSILDEEVRSFIENAERNFDKNNSDLLDVFYWNGADTLANGTTLLETFAGKWKPSTFAYNLITGESEHDDCEDRFIALVSEFDGGIVKYRDLTTLIISKSKPIDCCLCKMRHCSGDPIAFLTHDGDVMYCCRMGSQTVKLGNVYLNTSINLNYFWRK